ncbi:MAG: dockerin type I repeat-containing protein [Candidatus Sumerlaeota bacterium]|nr:dockerin type I repeat-containing protein [Candidatus Sumerlaeota bacterium]
MNEIRMKTKKLHSLTLALILVLGSTIFGIEPSHAALIYGDVSQEGTITAYDAALAAQSAVGSVDLTPTQLTAADVSGDNQVTAFDAALIAQYAVGLINKFPVEDIAISKVLIPGTGWTGPTEQPAAVGNSEDFGCDAKAIARWDVVPYQTFDSTFNVGVAAFHISGIDRVEFSVNGGPWLAVREMTLNPQTANHSGVGNPSNGVVEYWATLDASKFSTDGPIEVRAIAYPKIGVPRVLGGPMPTWDSVNNGEHSMFLNTNKGGTLTHTPVYVSITGSNTSGDGTQGNPFGTIYKAAKTIEIANGGDASNGIIYLMAGDYNWANGEWPDPATKKGFLTVMPAPGLTREQVRITSSGSSTEMDTLLVRVKGLTVYNTALAHKNESNAVLWFDNCTLMGSGRDADLGCFASRGWDGGIYITDCAISNVQNAARGMVLTRNTTVTKYGEDAYSSSWVVINSVASDIDSSGITPDNPPHPDVIQNGCGHNTIWYGVIATDRMAGSQGLSSGGETDMAIVNCHMATGGHQFYMDARDGPVTHLYMKSCIFSGTGGIYWSLPSAYRPMTTCTNVVVEDSWLDVARTIPVSGTYPGVTYK